MILILITIMAILNNTVKSEHHNESLSSSWSFNCDFHLDTYNCININCKGMKQLTKIPTSYLNLINVTTINQLICSIDLSETGIDSINATTMNNLNQIYSELVNLNKDHDKNIIKLLLSNITTIKQFRLEHANIVLIIRDSFVSHIDAKSFKHNRIDLNLINVTFLNTPLQHWLNLLDSTSLSLFTLRSIPLKFEHQSLSNASSSSSLLFPITTIVDLKIYNSNLSQLDDSFFMFKLIKYIEQIELSNCSIEHIRNKLFNKITFSYLRILSLGKLIYFFCFII